MNDNDANLSPLDLICQRPDAATLTNNPGQWADASLLYLGNIISEAGSDRTIAVATGPLRVIIAYVERLERSLELLPPPPPPYSSDSAQPQISAT